MNNVLDPDFKQWIEKSFKRGGVTTSAGNPEEYLLVRLDTKAIAINRIDSTVWNVFYNWENELKVTLDRKF